MDSPRQNPRDLKDHKPPPSPSTSPNSSSTSSTSSTTNGPPSAPPPSSSSLPPLTPKSNPNPTPTTPSPYPTTFIQADTQSFKQVVQMLTGSAETAAKRSTQTNPANSSFAPAHPHKSQIPPINRPTKKPAFKLYERRSSMKNLKMISPLIPSFPNCPSPAASAAAFSPRHHHHQPEILSPSILDFPKLVLSPVTPLSPDPLRSPYQLGISPEDRAIAEKGFYLHPSPRPTTPRDAEPPKLLPLFPLTSPRMESSAAAAAAAESSA